MRTPAEHQQPGFPGNMLRIAIVVAAVLAIVLLGFGVLRMIAGWQAIDHDHADNAKPTVSSVASPSVSPTLASTDVPGADIVDLPRYPDSIRVSYQQRTQSSLIVTRAEYVTSDDLQAVHTYIRAVIDERGWQVADIAFSDDERYFFVRDGAREATVTLTAHQGHVAVTVTLTEPQDDPTPVSTTPTPTRTPTTTSTPSPTLEPTPTPTPEPPPPPPPAPPAPEPPAPEPPAPEPTPDDDDDDDDDGDDD